MRSFIKTCRCAARCLSPPCAARRRRPTRPSRSPGSCRSPPAARPTRWRATSPSSVAHSWASRSSSRTRPAPAAPSAPARPRKAPPDGYTLLVGHMGYMGAAPALYRKLPYDPVKDFEPVFRFPDTPLVLLVPRQLAGQERPGADRLRRRRTPGKLNFGNAGVGSTSHLIAALFASSGRHQDDAWCRTRARARR